MQGLLKHLLIGRYYAIYKRPFFGLEKHFIEEAELKGFESKFYNP